MTENIKHTKSSGNVFEDLGFKDSKQRLVKAELAVKINELIEVKKLKQADAAKLIGVSQPKISDISRGNLQDFSIERLIEYLNRLDQDVEIVIHAKPKRTKRPAHFIVAFA